MPRTDFDEVYAGGQLVSSIQRIVSDPELQQTRPGPTKAQLLALVDAGPGGVPAGVIVMWGGLVANIPAGWALCNGLKGTPNLQGMFVKGAVGNPGATGGSATHSHGGHAAHVVTQPTAHAGAPTEAASAGVQSRGTTASTLTLAAHTHQTPVLSHAGTAVDAHSAHDFQTNEPAYYSLAFIQKL